VRGAGEVVTLSTESIASPQSPAGGSPAPACPACGSPLAADQRYCLECGERQSFSEFLRSGAPVGSSPPATPPQAPPAAPGAAPGPGRSNTVSLLAGIGVLLLAMGVGVLIGRSGPSKQGAAPVQVVTQPGAGTGGAGAEASFTGDWPSGTKGYTVQLQTLPVTGTTVAAVGAAKAAASAKGAASVGALKSSEFASLGGETYVIYSGDFHKRSEAEKALTRLKKNFPGAKVVEVSNKAAGGSSGSGGSNPAEARKKLAPGVGKSIDKPAPPTVLNGADAPKGKKAAEEMKNIPDVVSTG
jgi:hypothetical protein